MKLLEIVNTMDINEYQQVRSKNFKTGSGVSVNGQLAEELHKPVIKNLKRRKVYAGSKDNIWVADLAEMESLSSKNKNVKCLYLTY